MNAPVRQIVLCADDFGQSAAINAGILALIHAGRLSATSVLVEGPAWVADAPRLRELQSQAEIGVHLNLTHPFSSAPQARPLSYWLLRSQLRWLSRVALRDCFARQIEAFAQTCGRLPDYLDGHQHVHAFPVVRNAVIEAIDAHWQGCDARPWLRAPEALVDDGGVPFKAWVVRTACRGFIAHAQSHGVVTSAHFGGLYSLRPDDDFAQRMQHWLRTLPDGAMVMCHPGHASDDADDPLAATRRIEFAYLNSAQFVADCAQAGVKIARFRRH